MSKSIYEEALKHLNIVNDFVINWCDEIDLDYHDTYYNNYQKVKKALEKAQKQEKLLVLYKEFFDKLNIQLRNTFDIDYIYPHEFIIGYDIKSEDKELVKLFKQIKEIFEHDK